jgi:type II secretory pathway pseudopilin PulG
MHRPASRQRGFTYLGLLMAVVVMGLMLTLVSRVWRTTEQRERETQLLFIGHAYRIAISSYVALGHQYPPALENLLKDDRFPVPRRHLRRLYADPMTGQADWTLIMTPSGQGIMGVASSSQGVPIKRDGFEVIDAELKGADCYCAWQFVYYASRWNRPIGTGTAPGTIQPSTPGTPLSPGSQSPHYPGGAPGTIQPGGPGTFSPGAPSPLSPGGGTP